MKRVIVYVCVAAALAMVGCGRQEEPAAEHPLPPGDVPPPTEVHKGDATAAAAPTKVPAGYCHLCGMFVDDPEFIQVRDVPVGPWPECCPVCAIVDVLESTQDGSGTIVAHDTTTGEKIQVRIEGRKLTGVDPPGAVILFGGTCVTNKAFASTENAQTFKAENEWAADKPVKTWAEMVSMLSAKKSRIGRCAVCTADLSGHENTWFIVMTKDGKRKVCCCAHCGIFLYVKEKDNIKRMVTADYGTLQYIDARDAFYVVGHDQVTCCVPATAAFAKREDAERFAKEHGGTIYTLQEAAANIDKVMKAR